MSTDSSNRKSSLVEIFKAVVAILGVPLALFAIVDSIIGQPITSLIVALITAVIASVLVVRYGWTGVMEIIIAWLAMAVVVLFGFVIWPTTMTVEGLVRDEAGNPVSNEEVVLFDCGGRRYETQTDTEGHYQFTGVPTGKYKLQVRDSKVEAATKGFLVRVQQQDLTIRATLVQVSPTVTPVPPTNTPVSPTDIPTPESSTDIPAIEPTDTPSLPPTLTPRPTPIATPTNTPTLTPTPTATPTNTLTLTPTPVVCPRRSVGSRSPHTIIQSVSYSLNGRPPQAASNEEVLTVRPDDTISLLDLHYCSDVAGNSWDKVQGEAYLRKNGAFAYDDGRFTTGVAIQAGEHQPIGAFDSSWTIQSGWDRLVIALVHYYQGGHEVDDRFFINLVVQ